MAVLIGAARRQRDTQRLREACHYGFGIAQSHIVDAVIEIEDRSRAATVRREKGEARGRQVKLGTGPAQPPARAAQGGRRNFVPGDVAGAPGQPLFRDRTATGVGHPCRDTFPSNSPPTVPLGMVDIFVQKLMNAMVVFFQQDPHNALPIPLASQSLRGSVARNSDVVEGFQNRPRDQCGRCCALRRRRNGPV
jgi:hypothetical protein